jgi:predicted dehydrogenase
MTMPELRVAIVGCGQIAEAHLGELRLLKGVRVVAVCDLEALVAEDTADRHEIPRFYVDCLRMLDEERPDVVHLTTPPQTHLRLGREAIRRGVHIYVEKPFCVSAPEATALIADARQHGVLACAGFSERGDVVARRFRAFIESGGLGEVVHVESYYGDNSAGTFAALFRRTPDHWVNRLPGKVIHNVVPHALYHIVPLLEPGEGRLQCITLDRAGTGIYEDELRVMWQVGRQTASVTFTSAVRPVRQYLRVYGTKAIAEIDFTNHLFTVIDDVKLPGPVARIRNAVVPGARLIRQAITSARNTLTGRDRFFAGMGHLFEEFHAAIRNGADEPPVPYDEVIRVAELTDRIFSAASERVVTAEHEVV